MSKQLMRSGTSIGALVRESEHAQSRSVFIHKLAIAQKECSEPAYWLELLHQSKYLTTSEFDGQMADYSKILVSIITTTEQRM